MLTSSDYIAIGSAVMMVTGSIIGCTFWIATWAATLSGDLKLLAARMGELERRLERVEERA